MTPPSFPSISLLSSINMTSKTSTMSSTDIVERNNNPICTSSATYNNYILSTSTKKRNLTMIESFTTSGLGGMLGWAIVHPCNTVAVRMNLTPKGQVFSLSKMINEHGFLSLYAGIEAGLLRQLFYASSRFGLFELFRDMLHDIRGKTDFASRVGIGAVTGGMAAYISCPMEVCVVRMANDSSLPVDQRRNYTSVIDVASRIIKEEGIMAFWRGSNPFVTRAMMVGVFQVATLDQFQSVFTKYLNVAKGSIENVFCSAMSAGLIYSIATMPLEACKNRMASQKADPITKELPYKTVIQTLSKVSAEEGFFALYNGFVPYYLRCGGHTVAMFVIIKLLRDAILD
jgi:solute carrier family 25 (mitochondrial oxoglutarate transporter), member 11